jgi:hypothetical protein
MLSASSGSVLVRNHGNENLKIYDLFTYICIRGTFSDAFINYTAVNCRIINDG